MLRSNSPPSPLPNPKSQFTETVLTDVKQNRDQEITFFILTSTKSAKFHAEKLSISCEFIKLASRLNSFQIWHLVDFPDDHSRFQVAANTALLWKIWMANWRWDMTTYIGHLTTACKNVLQMFEGNTTWNLYVQICEYVKMISYDRSHSCIIEQI